MSAPSPSIHSVHLFDGVAGSLAAPFDNILWCINCHVSLTHVSVIYAGIPEDLIAAGCATPALIGPYIRGCTPVDEDGDRVLREFRKGWLRLQRIKPIALALQMPGVTINAIRAAKARHTAVCPWLSDYPDLSAYERPRPHLRLVVDNEARP
jgi:hypothetical protein